MKRKEKKKRRYVGVRLHIDLFKQIEKLSESEDCSFSHMVNQKLRVALSLKPSTMVQWLATTDDRVRLLPQYKKSIHPRVTRPPNSKSLRTR